MKVSGFWLAFLIASSSLASEKTLTQIMHEFAQSLVKMRVFATQQELTKEQELEILTSIEKFNKDVQAVDPSQVPSSRSYRVSLSALQRHLQETERMFRVGNKTYARWMLNATTSLCVMCHTQLPETKKPESFWSYKPKLSTTADKFKEAEFLFVTRRFQPAMNLYEDLIENFPENGLNTVELDNSLRRVVAYFARIKRDPNQAIEKLEGSLKNKKIPEAIQQNIQAWIGLFKKWKREPKKFNVASGTSKQLLAYVDKELSKTLWDRMIPANDPRVVSHLKVSGLIYDYLFSHADDSNTPALLLRLGKSEAALNNQFFYSLGDLYFRECIEAFPKSPVAKQCYSELEKSYTEAYTMTTGKSFPPEVESELMTLRQKLGIQK